MSSTTQSSLMPAPIAMEQPADVASSQSGGHALPPVMALSTIHASHAARSGYQLLVDYLPQVQFVSALRRDSRGFVGRNAMRAIRRCAFTRWYLQGCLSLEIKAARKILGGFHGVIHSLWGDHDLGFIDLVRNRSRQPLLATFHNCPDSLPQNLRFPSRLRKLDGIVLMSIRQAPFFLAAGVAPDKIHVVHHGVDVDYFVPAERRDESFTVLAVGGHRRNFPLLRDVCRRMQNDAGIRFRIFAPADRRPLFDELSNVEFATGVSDRALLSAYQTSSCLLLTLDEATANNALLEAMACGLPVISERVGGIPEYVDEASAILTEPKDPIAIIKEIRALAASHERQIAMRRAARLRAEQYDWRVVAERMQALYGTLL